MTVQVIDNLLSDEELDEMLQATVKNQELPWYASNVLSEDPGNAHNFQLVHVVHEDGQPSSGLHYALTPIFDKLDMFVLLRCKLNLNPYAGEVQYEHGYHCDISGLPDGLRTKTAVFYLNTNNGYTKLESTGEKVQSVANRLVIFDSRERHTGSTATDAAARYVVNINYIPR